MRHVLLVAEASEDLEAARDFYNQRERGIGDYCVDSLLTDIESLSLYHGIHRLQFGCHRMLASRFPFGEAALTGDTVDKSPEIAEPC